jgi:ABC-2 type transport system ATP-binding protein
MQARLAFSVATFSDPDVLLLDEVLAVGDQAFRERCFQRLREFHEGGGTLIVVSHDLPTVRNLCSRAVWLQHGRVRLDGSAGSVLDAYDEASDAEQTAITAVAR